MPVVGAVADANKLTGRRIGFDFGGNGGDRMVEDYGFQVFLPRRVTDRPRRQPIVEAGSNGAQLLAGHEGDGEFETIVEKQSDAVSLLNAEIGQKMGQSVHPRIQIAKAVSLVFVHDRRPVRPTAYVSQKILRHRSQHILPPPNNSKSTYCSAPNIVRQILSAIGKFEIYCPEN